MGVTILGNPAPIYDIHLSGPYPIENATGIVDGGWASGALPSLAYPPEQDSGTYIPREIQVFALEGGTVVSTRGFYRGINCIARMTTGGTARRVDGWNALFFMPVTDITNLDPGYANPSWRRVNWLRMGLAMDDSTLGAESGFMLGALAFQQIVEVWPSSISDFGTYWLGGMGLVGDGAGNWNWLNAGPQTFPPPAPPWSAPVIESVSLAPVIADASDWHTFDFITISGAGGKAGEYQLWVDDALFLTRNFVDAPALTGLGIVSGQEAFKYQPISRLATAISANIYFGDWTFRCGRFTKQGQELLK